MFSRPAARVARNLGQPNLIELICCFLHNQVYPDPDLNASEILLDDCPEFTGNISVYPSARTAYYAPSDLAGTNGMHIETIRSVTSWYGQYERHDTVLVQNGSEDSVMGGMIVARIRAFLSFSYDDLCYPCALIEWFKPVGTAPDPVTGMWIVKPVFVQTHTRDVDLIHLDCIIRSCLLQGVTNSTFLDKHHHYSLTHSSFRAFYVNCFADYHTHETYIW